MGIANDGVKFPETLREKAMLLERTIYGGESGMCDVCLLKSLLSTGAFGRLTNAKNFLSRKPCFITKRPEDRSRFFKEIEDCVIFCDFPSVHNQDAIIESCEID